MDIDYTLSSADEVATVNATIDSIISDELKLQIIQYNPPWTHCNYSENSRRNEQQQQQEKADDPYSLENVLMQLNGWSKYPEISIDGMNGTGKSSLCNRLNRKYIKINSLAHHVTDGSEYNYDPIKSMEYLMSQFLTKAENVCWDRCPYANLIFYFVHQLMATYKNDMIPDDFSKVWPILNTYALDTQLIAVINYTQSLKSIPILFIVCKDIAYISLALLDRGTANDVYNAKEYNYQMAQYHAYVYFGKVLQAPVLDLTNCITKRQNLNYIQMQLQRVIDIDKDPNNKGTLSLPNMDIVANFFKSLSVIGNDDVLIYDYSKK